MKWTHFNIQVKVWNLLIFFWFLFVFCFKRSLSVFIVPTLNCMNAIYGRGRNFLCGFTVPVLLSSVSFTFTFFRCQTFICLVSKFHSDFKAFFSSFFWLECNMEEGETQRALLTWLHSSLLTSFPFSLSYGKHHGPDAVKRIKYLTSYTNICSCKNTSQVRIWMEDQKKLSVKSLEIPWFYFFLWDVDLDKYDYNKCKCIHVK